MQLTPYHTNWSIHARITYKDQQIKHITKNERELKLFEIHLTDDSVCYKVYNYVYIGNTNYKCMLYCVSV